METPDEVLRALVAPIVASESWVIDGTYQRKLGRLVLDAADLIVWLDLPVRVWLPRLTRRTWRRLRGREPLWNDNRESVASAILGWDSLFVFALRTHFARRRDWPRELTSYPVIRLRSPAAVREFLRSDLRTPATALSESASALGSRRRARTARRRGR